MCLNPFKIKDVYHSLTHMYVPCGKCPVCRQSLADRRAQKIICHEPKGFRRYMITLTYMNEFIPYIRISDVIDTLTTMRNLTDDDIYLDEDIDYLCSVPIYRDFHFTKGRNPRPYKPQSFEFGTAANLIDWHRLSKSYSDTLISSLRGLRTKLNINTYAVDPDKISVCYTPDFQNFIKRLRSNYKYKEGKRLQMSYYYAPEYGPTGGRFHIHALLYLPEELSLETVQDYVCQAWPYADKNRTREYVQIGVKPAHYVASYVNCDSNVSSFLQEEFPLRSSHSLHFGFGANVLELKEIIKNFRYNRDFRYTTYRTTSDGTIEEALVYYPRYAINRYFPKFKGYSRTSIDTLYNIYRDPQEYFKVIKSSSVGWTETGEPLYMTNIRSVGGKNISMTLPQMNYHLNSILRAQSLFAELGYSKFDYALFTVEYQSRLSQHIYRNSIENNFNHMFEFHNLDDIRDGLFRHIPTEEYLKRHNITFNPETFPQVLDYNKLKYDKFYKTIKQKKLTQFNSL